MFINSHKLLKNLYHLKFPFLMCFDNAIIKYFYAMKIKAIIFDLGGVLVDWNPDYLFDKVFDDAEKKKYFFDNVCTPDWNEEQDAGRSIKEATETLVAHHPDWKEHIETYYNRWEEMLGGPIHDTVAILKELK